MTPFLDDQFFLTFLPEIPFSGGKNQNFPKRKPLIYREFDSKSKKKLPSVYREFDCVSKTHWTDGLFQKNHTPENFQYIFDGSTKFKIGNLIFEFQKTKNCSYLPK